MNKYSTNILKQFTIKRGRLYYITGPMSGKPAGHERPNGVIYVRFNGEEYKHHDLLILYQQQLESKHLATIETDKQYQTISGNQVKIYTDTYHLNATPYVIHGAVRKDNFWYATQWTEKGEHLDPSNNLELIK